MKYLTALFVRSLPVKIMARAFVASGDITKTVHDENTSQFMELLSSYEAEYILGGMMQVKGVNFTNEHRRRTIQLQTGSQPERQS